MKRMLVAAAVLAGACAIAPRTPVGVVLITLDTARADRLSPYGFGDATMPALDRLAREGVVFDQATTVAPLTLPAHTSLLTGLLPPRHSVRENASAPLADQHVTLAEILEARGYRTGAFVGSRSSIPTAACGRDSRNTVGSRTIPAKRCHSSVGRYNDAAAQSSTMRSAG
jgi:glucan phosphoethanolaminetransferase (alkaline phosphatase superfamily)